MTFALIHIQNKVLQTILSYDHRRTKRSLIDFYFESKGNAFLHRVESESVSSSVLRLFFLCKNLTLARGDFLIDICRPTHRAIDFYSFGFQNIKNPIFIPMKLNVELCPFFIFGKSL